MTIAIEHEAKETLELERSEEEIIRDVVFAALEYEGCPYEAEVNVVVTDNEEIRALNRQYREMDVPTDVLSFPMLEFETPSDFSHVEDDYEDCFNPETGELMLGDIILSAEKIREQAESYGHSQTRELAFLVAHSMLHLCGYDHVEEAGRKEMERKQREILELRGYKR